MTTMHDHNTKKHNGRNDLIGEYKWGDLGQVILLVLFMAIWIIDSFFLKYSTFLAESVSVWIRMVTGTAILFYAWKLSRSGLKIVFGEKRENPEVIKKGVFSKVRHPIYLGAILLYLGLICYTLSLFAAGFWVIIIIFYIGISRYEEKILINHFGDDYSRYKKDVPMLFPKIRTR